MLAHLLISVCSIPLTLNYSEHRTLCCYGLEEGWIAFRLRSESVQLIRHGGSRGEPRGSRLPEISATLSLSNVAKPNLAVAIGAGNFWVEYEFDTGQVESLRVGFTRYTRFQGECSAAKLFDGRIVDTQGKPTSLRTMNVTQRKYPNGFGSQISFGDLLPLGEKGIVKVGLLSFGVEYVKLAWFSQDNKLFEVFCPFDEPFKIYRVGDFYYFVTESGRLYKSACDKDGVSKAIKRVHLGLGTVVTGAVTDVRSKKVFLFTKSGFQELGEKLAAPKELEFGKKSIWKTDDVREFSHQMYDALVAGKHIEPVKPDAK